MGRKKYFSEPKVYCDETQSNDFKELIFELKKIFKATKTEIIIMGLKELVEKHKK